ncbi:MAG: HAMP domain-containing sensor histidine kinase [Cyclobacteriaceae bacterium]
MSKLTDYFVAKLNVEFEDPFEAANFHLLVNLTIVFSIVGTAYGLHFLLYKNYFSTVFTIAGSLVLVLIPITIKYIQSQTIKDIIYIVLGIVFFSIVFFASGSTLTAFIVLWVVYILNLSLVAFSRRGVVIFFILISFLFVLRYLLLRQGIQFPNWTPKEIVEAPKFIDLAVPAFYNLYMVLTGRVLQLQAKELIVQEKINAEEANRLKSKFITNISHEIGTPMNAISGFSELLEQTEIVETKRKEFLQLIRSKSQHLLSIINNIITISKLETGSISPTPTLTNPNLLFQQIIETANASDSAASNLVKVEIAMGLDEELLLDHALLSQALGNLVDNAIKFTKNGFVKLGCERQDDRLHFFVHDTGIGLAEEHVTKIFEPFYKVHETYEYGGTGLGLPIAKGLIEIMNGRIWLESSPEKGSVFHFTLPELTVVKNE